MKNYYKNNDREHFLEEDFEYPKKNYLSFIKIYHFYLEVRKQENVISSSVTFLTKKLWCTYKGFKTSTKSRINTKKSGQSNSI